MKQTLSFSFVVGLALVSPAAAQVTGGVAEGVIGGVPGGVLVGRPVIAPLPPMAPLAPMMIGPGPWYDQQDREAARQDRERDQKNREIQRAQSERDRESSLYEQGNNAIYEVQWDRAVTYFSRLADLKAARADSALYWKSYAQNRLGQRADALSTLTELTKSYPNSRYLKEARALEVEVRGSAGQPVRPDAQADEELKIYAMNALANSDPAQAVPMLEKQLAGTGSPRLKGQALFVLAQMNNPRAREVLLNIAKGSSIPELQSRAIQYLGANGGRESGAALAEIYSSSTDVDVKRRILRAFTAAGEKDRLLNAAQTEQNPELRAEAVRQLGAMGANDELWQMYQKETSVDVKRQILSAMQVGGNTARMVEIARTEKDADLRRLAVRNLGVMGGRTAGDALVEIYSADKDPAIRRTVINSLFTQGNAAALVALARKEQDITMKTEMVKRLSNMDSKEARDYMVELLK
jgi:HEAT repeat protein